MSKKSRKSQSVTVTAPVVVADIPEIAVAAVEAAADVLDAGGTLEAAADAFDTVAAPLPQKVKKYPREGGKCWQVWNKCDELVAAGTNPSVADLRAHALAHNWNVSNASQEFYAWRKFHGRK